MKKVILISEQDFASLIQKVISKITGNSDENEKEKVSPKKTSSIPTNFDDEVNKVINNFEGGYYHPDMLKDGRISGGAGLMGDSGETMMGMDRLHGSGFNNTSAGIEFWSLIDKAGARKKWKYQYMGGPLENRLRKLVSEMIKPEFDRLSNLYLTPKARQIVKDSPELTFHFIYATWNGPGWFRKFATVINEAVDKGITNPSTLIQLAMKSRKQSSNALITKSGEKMSKLFNV